VQLATTLGQRLCWRFILFLCCYGDQKIVFYVLASLRNKTFSVEEVIFSLKIVFNSPLHWTTCQQRGFSLENMSAVWFSSPVKPWLLNYINHDFPLIVRQYPLANNFDTWEAEQTKWETGKIKPPKLCFVFQMCFTVLHPAWQPNQKINKKLF